MKRYGMHSAPNSRTVRKNRIAKKTFRVRLILMLAVAAVISLVISSVVLTFINRDLPDPSMFRTRAVRQSTKIYDRTGEVLLYEVHGEERRTVIPFEEIPDTVKYATLAAEDASFYSHPAFDWKAIMRAIFHNIRRKEGESIQGGSTITQQLVKNAFLKPERTLSRKVKELILAVQFERQYSKDEILGFYLNQVPYGSNAYGIEAAAQTYFNKSARDLTLAEAAILASLTKAPSYLFANPDALIARQRYVLDRMADKGFITRDKAEEAKNERIVFASPIRGIRAPHFVMYVIQLLEEKYGRETVENGGLKVFTTLDWELQETAEQLVKEYAKRNEENWHAFNAALVAEDPKTGQILAMVGSRDYFGLSQPEGCTPGLNCKFDPKVNIAIRLRQPGSALKPLVYYALFKKGYTPQTILFDLPTEFNPNCSATSKPLRPDAVCYSPKNYDKSWRGPVTLRQALAQSLNIPSVKALYLAGIDEVLATASDFGITTLKENPGFYGLSLVLGGGGVKLLELVHAYSVLADDGMFHTQTPFLRVEDSEGVALEIFDDRPIRVADANTVRIVNDILSDSDSRRPVFPVGALDVPGYNIAAKTGTSQDYRDAWVFGYTPSIVTGIWVGNNDNTPMDEGGAGISAAGPLMRAFMTKTLLKFQDQPFPEAEIPVVSKPMLSGRYITTDSRGASEAHTILYYVDRKDPLGPIPTRPDSDPQFQNWEIPVIAWASLRMPQSGFMSPSPSPKPTPEILILEPQENAQISGNGFTISVELKNFTDVSGVRFFFNGSEIDRMGPSSDNIYTLYFVPKTWNLKNEIKIQVYSGKTVVTARRTIIR